MAPARKIHVRAFDEQLPALGPAARGAQPAAGNIDARPHLLGDCDDGVDPNAFGASFHPDALDVKGHSLDCARLHILHRNILGDDDKIVDLFAVSPVDTRALQAGQRQTLDQPLAAIVGGDRHGRALHQQLVHDQLPIENQAQQVDADIHLAGINQLDGVIASYEFRLIKIEFRTTESPTRIHSDEFHLCPNRLAGPLLYFFLVLRQPRQ